MFPKLGNDHRVTRLPCNNCKSVSTWYNFRKEVIDSLLPKFAEPKFLTVFSEVKENSMMKAQDQNTNLS